MARLQLRQSKPGLATLVTAIPTIVWSMSGAHINTNINFIQKTLKLTAAEASWIMNIETLGSILCTTMTGKLAERFGSTLIMTIGMGVTFLFNLCFMFPFVHDNYIVVLIFRALASIGLGLAVPTVMPVNYILVAPQQLQTVISINSLTLPVSAVASNLISGLVANKAGWQWMCVIVGFISLFGVIVALFLLPFNVPRNPIARVDFIGTALLGGGLVSLIFGLLSLTGTTNVPLYVAIILCCVGAGMIVFFFVYDQKWAKNKIFHPKLLNKSVLTIEVLLFFSAVCQYGDKYLIPYNLQNNFQLNVQRTGFFMALGGLSAFIFSPLANMLIKRRVVRGTMIASFFLYLVFDALNAFQITFFPTLWLYMIAYCIVIGAYVLILIHLQSFNFAQCPPQFGSAVGVFNQLVTKVGNSIGVTLVVLIQQFSQPKDAKPYAPISISTPIWCLCVCVVICIIASTKLGVLQTERGKKGFSERLLANTRGFESTASAELIEKDEFQGEAQASKMDTFLSLFQSYEVHPDAVHYVQFTSEEMDVAQPLRNREEGFEGALE